MTLQDPRKAQNGIADENWSLLDTKCFTFKKLHIVQRSFLRAVLQFLLDPQTVLKDTRWGILQFTSLHCSYLSPCLILFLKWLYFKLNFSKIKLSFRASSKLVPKANIGALLQDWYVSILQICVDGFIFKISISERQCLILSLMCFLWGYWLLLPCFNLREETKGTLRFSRNVWEKIPGMIISWNGDLFFLGENSDFF